MTSCVIPSRHTIPIVLVAILACPLVAEARPWTSTDGKTVEAEFVEFSEDGKSVLLDISGRRFFVPLDRLSDKDRAYLAELKPAEDAALAGDVEVSQQSDDDLSRQLRAERTWTARDGTTMKARLIRIYSGTVLLREGDRSRRVRFYDLSVADRKFLSEAYTATGEASVVPPVRPELVDLIQTPPESVAADAATTDPAAVPASEVAKSASQDEIVLPPSGFGSLEGSDSEKKTPSPPAELEKPIVLPPSGFGSLQEEQVVPASESASSDPPNGFGADIVLPPSGFGSADRGGTGSADDFFEEAGNTPPDQATLPPQSSSGSEAMLPESGFGSLPANSDVGDSGIEEREVPSPGHVSSAETLLPVDQRANLTDSPRPPDSRINSPHSTQPSNPQAQPFPPRQSFVPPSAVKPVPPQAGPVELSGAQWNLRLFGIALLSSGCFLVASSYLWLITQAFLESFRGGLRSLVPGTVLMLTLADAEQSNTPLITLLFGGCLALGGCGLLLS